MNLLTLSFTKDKFLIIQRLITITCIILAIFCNDSNQNLIAFLGIFSFGILHGANDLKIINKNFKKNQKKLKDLFFLSYVLVVILGIVIFYWIPGIALISFVIISCYHFGEQHMERIMDLKKGKLFFYFTYGAFIFLMIFSLHYNETAKVIFQISGKVLPFTFFIYSLLLTSIAIIIQALFHFKKSKLLMQEFFLLGLLALLFVSSNLLFSFGIYFGVNFLIRIFILRLYSITFCIVYTPCLALNCCFLRRSAAWVRWRRSNHEGMLTFRQYC